MSEFNPFENHRFRQLSVLDQSPAHANALGLMLANWAFVEDKLELGLQFILDIDRDVAKAIYQHFPSTTAKIDLLIRLNRLKTSTPESLEKISKLLIEAKNLNSMRNAYVHSMWAINQDHPGQLLRIRMMLPKAEDSKKTEYEKLWLSAQKILDDVAKIAKWSQDFFDLLHHIDPKRLNRPAKSEG